MFKLAGSAFSLICLLAAAFLLWQSPGFSEALPSGTGGWLAAWFGLFHDPATAVALFALCAALAVTAACVTELLLGLFFSLLTAAASALCLLGVVGSRYPPMMEYLERFLK